MGLPGSKWVCRGVNRVTSRSSWTRRSQRTWPICWGTTQTPLGICHPLWTNVRYFSTELWDIISQPILYCHYNTPALGPIGNYTALGLHFSALGMHYPALGPPRPPAALWRDNAPQGRKNVARGRYNFQLYLQQGCDNLPLLHGRADNT